MLITVLSKGSFRNTLHNDGGTNPFSEKYALFAYSNHLTLNRVKTHVYGQSTAPYLIPCKNKITQLFKLQDQKLRPWFAKHFKVLWGNRNHYRKISENDRTYLQIQPANFISSFLIQFPDHYSSNLLRSVLISASSPYLCGFPDCQTNKCLKNKNVDHREQVVSKEPPSYKVVITPANPI